MRAAGDGRFDAVLTESLDRLSRDLEDIAGIHKRLQFAGVKIVTLADGLVGKMHVGLKGMIASMFLDDLALKTKRGQVGRVKEGRIPGGRCYGYDVVPSLDERGQRTINEAEAATVRRIFEEYAGGRSPFQIVKRLNAEHVPSPRGGPWNTSTLVGSRKRQNGILNNSLYAGRIVFNRQSFIKDPETGKRQARENPRDQWLEKEVPELRIVPEELFETVKALRLATGGARPERCNRPKHLFSGLVICGLCGGSMTSQRVQHGRDVGPVHYLGCSTRRNCGACDNARNISTAEISSRVLDALQKHLLQPNLVELAVETYRKERERLAKEISRTRRDVERDLAAVERKIKALLTMVENGSDPRAAAVRMNELEAERRMLEQAKPGNPNTVTVHPSTAVFYAETVRQLKEVLAIGKPNTEKAVAFVRELIDHIVISPTPKGEPVEIDLVGNLAALFMEPSANRVVKAMVAGAGFEPTTFRL